MGIHSMKQSILYDQYKRTVVRIHMRAATLAPMAIAPAVPPRTADAADFSRISRSEPSFFGGTGGAAAAAVSAELI